MPTDWSLVGTYCLLKNMNDRVSSNRCWARIQLLEARSEQLH